LTLQTSIFGEACFLNFVEAYPPVWHCVLRPKGEVSLPYDLFLEMDDERPRREIIYLVWKKASSYASSIHSSV